MRTLFAFCQPTRPMRGHRSPLPGAPLMGRRIGVRRSDAGPYLPGDPMTGQPASSRNAGQVVSGQCGREAATAAQDHAERGQPAHVGGTSIPPHEPSRAYVALLELRRLAHEQGPDPRKCICDGSGCGHCAG